ncbi:MAG: lipocalin-like domain-containing protein [Acidobacteriota bacterium]
MTPHPSPDRRHRPGRQRLAEGLAARPVSFPRNHASHPEYRIEWWYNTGNLTTGGGRRFGYQLTGTRRVETPGRSSTLRRRGRGSRTPVRMPRSAAAGKAS